MPSMAFITMTTGAEQVHTTKAIGHSLALANFVNIAMRCIWRLFETPRAPFNGLIEDFWRL